MRSLALFSVICVLAIAVMAQSPPPSSAPPSSANEQSEDSQTSPTELPAAPTKARPGVPPPDAVPLKPNDSSSRSSILDLSPPLGDAQEHPDSAISTTDVNEMHPWNPHRAAKDVEVGDYYFKRKNYRGAEGRYRDALYYKPDDAVSTYRLGQICETTGRSAEAIQFYQNYLKILPHGPYAEDAQKALRRLQAATASK